MTKFAHFRLTPNEILKTLTILVESEDSLNVRLNRPNLKIYQQTTISKKERCERIACNIT